MAIPRKNIIKNIEDRRKNLNSILNNEKTKIFGKIPKGFEQIMQRQAAVNLYNLPSRNYASSINFNNKLINSLYQGLSDYKLQRLRELRRIADSSEMTIALREIADEFLNEDRECKYIQIRVRNQPDEVIDVLRKEFYSFMEIFKLKEKGWNYCKEFLTDGEKFFENLISIESPELGIVGLCEIPPERIEPIYRNKQNDEIEIFKINVDPGFASEDLITNQKLAMNDMSDENYIDYDPEQVTYIHSGEWCPQRMTKKSHISNALRDFRIHYLMEDTNLIYITARAPQRLLFKIPTDNMPDDMAQEHLRRQAAEFNTQQSVNSNGIAAYHNPQSQLENYYVATNNGVGVDIQTIGGDTQLDGRLQLIKYFASKLYQALQIPTSRLNPESQYSDGSSVTVEEVKFGKMIERLQSRFAVAIKKTFITHLKLKGKDVKGLKEFLNLKYNKNENDEYGNKQVNLKSYKEELRQVESSLEKHMHVLNEQIKKYNEELSLISENYNAYNEEEYTQEEVEYIRNEIKKIEQRLMELISKNKSIWDQYELEDNDIDIIFNAPNAYNALKKQQQLSIKLDTLGKLMEIPFMSLAYALKYGERFDGGPLTNSEINQLYVYAIAEQKLKAQLSKIENGEDIGSGGGGGGLSGLGGGDMSDFGGGGAGGGSGDIPKPVLPDAGDIQDLGGGSEPEMGGGGAEPSPSETPAPESSEDLGNKE